MELVKQIRNQSPFKQVLILLLIGVVASFVLSTLSLLIYQAIVGEDLSMYPMLMSSEQPVAFMFVYHLPLQLGMFLLPGLLYAKIDKVERSVSVVNVFWSVLAFVGVLLILPFLTAINIEILNAFGAYDGAMASKETSDTIVLNLIEGKSVIVFGVAVLVIAIITGVAEEFFFRRFVYGHLKRNAGKKWLALLVSSLFFALLHGNYIQLIPLLTFGMLLAIVYDLSGTIWLGITLHALNNALNLYWMYTDSFPKVLEELSVFVSLIGFGLLSIFLFVKKRNIFNN